MSILYHSLPLRACTNANVPVGLTIDCDLCGVEEAIDDRVDEGEP